MVDEIFDEKAADVMGLKKDRICVMIHSGSRGLGYQVCDDSLAALRKVPAKYGIELPDRQLACAPVHSPEGQEYLGAMRCAANYAWANRQLLDVADPRGLCRSLRPHVGIAANGPDLRRRPQHRQDRGARGRRPAAEALRASQGGHPRVSGRAIPTCPSNTARSASR